MSRHQRRADLAEFKREAHKAHLVTYMVAADDNVALDRHPLLSRAVSFWRAGIPQRRPFCPACKRGYADDADPGAFLFAVPALAPSSVSVSAFCDRCWLNLTDGEVEATCHRVLPALLPGGKFEARR
jgi:hypothetical protein